MDHELTLVRREIERLFSLRLQVDWNDREESEYAELCKLERVLVSAP